MNRDAGSDPPLRARLGKGCRVHPSAIAGHPADRPGRRAPLVLGPGANIRSGSVLYEGTRVGRRLQTGHHVVVREDCVLGDDVCLWAGTVIDHSVRIGNRVLIHCNVYVSQRTRLEDDVFVAPGAAFANDKWPIDKANLVGPVVRRWARIGVNATILPGVEIGRGAMVGSGSVVTRDVPPWAVVVGVPARVIGKVPLDKRRRS